MPYLLKDQRGRYDFIEPFVWNHFCYSFKRGGYSKAAMVSKIEKFFNVGPNVNDSISFEEWRNDSQH